MDRVELRHELWLKLSFHVESSRRLASRGAEAWFLVDPSAETVLTWQSSSREFLIAGVNSACYTGDFVCICLESTSYSPLFAIYLDNQIDESFPIAGINSSYYKGDFVYTNCGEYQLLARLCHLPWQPSRRRVSHCWCQQCVLHG